MSVTVFPGTREYVLAAAGELHVPVRWKEEEEDWNSDPQGWDFKVMLRIDRRIDANVSVTVLPGTGEYVLAAAGELHLQVILIFQDFSLALIIAREMEGRAKAEGVTVVRQNVMKPSYSFFLFLLLLFLLFAFRSSSLFPLILALS